MKEKMWELRLVVEYPRWKRKGWSYRQREKKKGNGKKESLEIGDQANCLECLKWVQIWTLQSIPECSYCWFNPVRMVEFHRERQNLPCWQFTHPNCFVCQRKIWYPYNQQCAYAGQPPQETKCRRFHTCLPPDELLREEESRKRRLNRLFC